MDPSKETIEAKRTAGSPSDVERLVYVLREEGAAAIDREIDFLSLWGVVWQWKWLPILVTVIAALSSVVYALTAKEYFRAEVLLAPAAPKSGAGGNSLGTLASLAGLAGISVGGANTAEALAILKSRELTTEFLLEQDLLKVLFADRWNAAKGEWRAANPRDVPDVRDAVKFFDESVRVVREDRSTGLIALSIEWSDPELAAEWANLLVKRANERMRSRALAEAETNVEYLRQQLNETSLVTLQQPVARLLESEMQKVMLARGNDEFAFRVLDSARPPKRRSRPDRFRIVALSTIGAAAASLIAVFFLNAIRLRRLQNRGDRPSA